MYEYGKLNVTSDYKDLDQLKNMKPINWIQESNVLLQSFFENSTGAKLKCEASSENNVLAHSTLSKYWYKYINLNLIQPSAFTQNVWVLVVQFSVTWSPLRLKR